ncbi:hypothetical protein IGI04_006713 [Brassica rapa subsp. trilocularis]|uniref:Uncharacterized protein n=1 Tax=Brassica rapa subsp. trilocularis TaxID=1813537 RepID=A0ABQ7NHR9_BRACM|nr:hypothetical protein IGI04_006713 [Brassica rapa subsp. trilocularis]
MRRNLIAEISVDMTKKDQWGYVEIIAKGSMGTTVSALGNYVEPVVAEFYAGLPNTKVEADAYEIAVQVRGHTYEFSPTMINEALHVQPLDEDEGPVVYTKDKRFGEIYEQHLAKAKGKAKKGGEGKLSSRSAHVSHPLPSFSSAPTLGNTTGPRRFSVHDLGSVSIPQGLLTQDDLQTVLQQTTRALQALTDIDTRSWSSEITSIQGRINEGVSLKEVLEKKQSNSEERKIGLFAEEEDMKSFH